MESSSPAHVLVVAHGAGATAGLLEAVRERVAQGPAWFHVLVPDPSPPDWVRGRAEHRRRGADAELHLDRAVALIEAAGHHPTDGSVSVRSDPMDAIEEALYGGDFDEIILATPASGAASRRLRIDLPSRVAHLGPPLTTVIAESEERTVPRDVRIRRRHAFRRSSGPRPRGI